MKCTKCGREMRIAPEQVGLDKNCAPIYHRFSYCDNCKIKTDIDMYKSSKNKKDSTLSILAAIFTILICTFYVGGLLGLIDIFLNDKTKRHLGSWFAVISSIVLFLIFIVVGTSDNSDTSKITDNNKSNTNISQDLENDNNTTNSNIITVNHCDIEYLRYETKKEDDAIELLVYFKFTNNSNENKAWWLTADCKAFQNGIELDTDYWHDTEESKNTDKEIQPGYSIEVCEEFLLNDATNNVTIQLSELYNLNNKIEMEVTIELSE